MARAFLVVMDSVGCGGAPDAGAFGDEGSNTLAHIAQACAEGRATEGRSGPLALPNLESLGLGPAVVLASGADWPNHCPAPTGAWGAATEVSPGKDTPSGHWELAGVPVPWDWHYFPDTTPSFPDDVVAETCRLAGTEGILGNCHASGTEIIARLGEEHLKTGWPICYTSADSVFQIAAHEEAFGLERLLDLCKALAPMLHEMRIGRVIARPFVGEPGALARTTNRKDFAVAPPGATLLDVVQDNRRRVRAIGKIGDIFSMRGIDELRKGSDSDLMEHLIEAVGEAPEGSLTFANFVEFDSLFGHRRDVSGYARALEWFDSQLPRVFMGAHPDDLFVFTADHGNDPTWTGSDHTRERVPVLCHGAGARAIGNVAFVDVAATVAAHLDVTFDKTGRNFL